MTDSDEASSELAPRSWRTYHRSKRARDMRRELSAVDESLVVTDWWKQPSVEAAPTSPRD